MLPLFLATCSIVIGLGVVVPLLPFYAVSFGATAFDVAMLFAIYSGSQFLMAPAWGRLSDRVGRKPVLLLCYAGTAASYVWFAYAGSLTEMYLSRALAGGMSAWFVAGQAWVADTTEPERRARGMGLLGAAFGIGFVIGPTIGAIAVGAEHPDFRTPILFSAAASALAFLIAAFAIREPAKHTARDGDITETASRMLSLSAPLLPLLLGIYFASFFIFVGMESMLALWTKAALGLGPRHVGLLMAFAGVCMVIVQGGLLGRLAGRFGEARLIVAGIAIMLAGMLAVPMMGSWAMMLLPMGLLAVGQSLTNPSIQSLVSRVAPADWKGGVLGLAQGAASIGRITGPLWAGLLYERAGHDWPFFGGAILLVPVFLAALFAGRMARRRMAAAPVTAD
jgi:DHA1 family tetracycline resistance protein-like MFS transporter